MIKDGIKLEDNTVNSFLMIGQSNMAGRGYAGPDDLTVIPRLLMIRPDFKWQPAVEPSAATSAVT